MLIWHSVGVLVVLDLVNEVLTLILEQQYLEKEEMFDLVTVSTRA